MFLKPIDFKIASVGEIESGYLQNLAKEGINFKSEDIELEVVTTNSDSPLKRVVLGKKIEIKAIMIGSEWAQTPANELLSFDYNNNIRSDDFNTNSLNIDFNNN